jgi:hypothetical protein
MPPLQLGPYDNTVYGNFNYDQKNGWSNDNEFEANYQRLFHHGFAYQIFYVWSRAFRVGDNGFRDSQGYPAADYYGTANNANVTVTPPPLGSRSLRPRSLPGYRPDSRTTSITRRWMSSRITSSTATFRPNTSNSTTSTICPSGVERGSLASPTG